MVASNKLGHDTATIEIRILSKSTVYSYTIVLLKKKMNRFISNFDSPETHLNDTNLGCFDVRFLAMNHGLQYY